MLYCAIVGKPSIKLVCRHLQQRIGCYNADTSFGWRARDGLLIRWGFDQLLDGRYRVELEVVAYADDYMRRGVNKFNLYPKRDFSILTQLLTGLAPQASSLTPQDS